MLRCCWRTALCRAASVTLRSSKMLEGWEGKSLVSSLFFLYSCVICDLFYFINALVFLKCFTELNISFCSQESFLG